jgi:DNA-binding MurR/RpiR family transcriptional regulator
MGTPTPLEERLIAVQDHLHPARRALLQSVLRDSSETFFLTSRALARRYGVDVATIVRTVQALGYARFADFSADLRQDYLRKLTPYAVVPHTTPGRLTSADCIRSCFNHDLANLHSVANSLDLTRVSELARRIRASRRVVVVGGDYAFSLASYLAWMLRVLGVDCRVPSGTGADTLYTVRLLNHDDLVVAISFGRCLKSTVRAVIAARDRSVATFGVTDTLASPIARHCDSHLIAPILNPCVGGSYVAPVALINAIEAAFGERDVKRLTELQGEFEAQYSPDRWWSEADEKGASNATRRPSSRAPRGRRPGTATRGRSGD